MCGLDQIHIRNNKSLSLEEFNALYKSDADCAEYLASVRWQDGFVCPKCGGKRGWRLKSRAWVYQCAGDGELQRGKRCRHQTSVIAGTIMHGTHIPLLKWFTAAYLVATHSNGISALQLQSKIGVSYQAAWKLLQKLRKVMVNPDREPLSDTVEIDETFIPHRESDDTRDISNNHLIVAGAVEAIDRTTFGRIRLKYVDSKERSELEPFIMENTLPGSTVVTDGNPSYGDLVERDHLVKNLSRKEALPAHIELPGVHRFFSNLKRWGLGVYHGFRRKHVDAYLQEFVFRWNRRSTRATSMKTLLTLGMAHGQLTYRQIVGDTREWRIRHRDQIYRMTNPDRLKEAIQIAESKGQDILDVLAEMPRTKAKYKRTPAIRPVLGTT